MNKKLDMEGELKRIKRVSDQQITAHNICAENFKLYSFTYEVITLFASILVISTVFVDPKLLKLVLPESWNGELVLGIASIILFFLSIVNILTDWKAKSWSHKSAADRYFSIKRDCNKFESSEELNPTEWNKITENYRVVGENSPPIPDKKFAKYKAKHLRKIRISKYLDDHPHTSILILNMRFWVLDNIVCIFKDKKK